MNCIEKILHTPLCSKGNILTYLCLEQPETIDYIEYLELGPATAGASTVIFNSDSDEQNRKGKRSKSFEFEGIFNRADKVKHYFSNQIKEISERAINGQNQSILLYGTEEKCKDKLLFGESQNPGLFLCVLSEIFDLCHKKGLEDYVTIKISSSLFRNASFIETFTNITNVEPGLDMFEGCILHMVPEVIIRNVKTGLKIISIILKALVDTREEELTENLIMTLKFELDCKKKEEETLVYCISKLHFIKLANPSVNNSLKGINKNNVWFINFLNLLQAPKHDHPPLDYLSPLPENIDRFTAFINEEVLQNCSKVYGLVSLNNKMSSNQCLTALLFGTHLKNQEIHPQRHFIHFEPLRQQTQIKEGKILQRLQNKVEDASTNGEWKIWAELLSFLELLGSYVTEMNYLEYEYSLFIGEACEKLGKYIFTEELEDFFYAKKTNLEPVEDLFTTYHEVRRFKDALCQSRKRLIHLAASHPSKAAIESLVLSYFSMAHHFLYEENEELKNKLKAQVHEKETEQKKVLQQLRDKEEHQKWKREWEKKSPQKKRDATLDEVKEEGSGHKSSRAASQPPLQRSPFKKEQLFASINDLECMFKNKNVNLKKWLK